MKEAKCKGAYNSFPVKASGVGALPVAHGAPGSLRQEKRAAARASSMAPGPFHVAAFSEQSLASFLSPAAPPHPQQRGGSRSATMGAPQLCIFISGGVSGFPMSHHQELVTRHHLHHKFHIKLWIQTLSKSLLKAPKMSKVKPLSPDSTGQDDHDPCGWPFRFICSPRSRGLIAQPGSEPDDPGQEVLSVLLVSCAGTWPF